VLAETERDGHRVCFNGAFKEKGLPSVWDVDTYGELLKIGGGKERMRKCVHGGRGECGARADAQVLRCR